MPGGPSHWVLTPCARHASRRRVSKRDSTLGGEPRLPPKGLDSAVQNGEEHDTTVGTVSEQRTGRSSLLSTSYFILIAPWMCL